MIRRSLIVVAAALIVAAPVVAAAGGTGGISGYVVDVATMKPVPGAAVLIALLPETPESRQSVLANRRGYFVHLGLEPGRYVVTANVQGRAASCVIDDVYADQVRRVKIELGTSATARCVGNHVHRSVVNPDETADVYRIR